MHAIILSITTDCYIYLFLRLSNHDVIKPEWYD